MTSYADRLKHPRWQRRRLEILNRFNFTCEQCGSTEKSLHVHHKLYRKGAMPWDYADNELQVLCEECHASDHQWRTWIDEAIAKLPSPLLESVTGYIEALAAAQACFDSLTHPTDTVLQVRSPDHAIGVAAAFRLDWSEVTERGKRRPTFSSEEVMHMVGRGELPE